VRFRDRCDAGERGTRHRLVDDDHVDALDVDALDVHDHDHDDHDHPGRQGGLHARVLEEQRR
jgi:hypothetical protein